MSSLISMCCYDSPDNGRTRMTEATLASLRKTVNFTRHSLVISDNGSCPETHALYKEYDDIISDVIYNGSNIGTANALNKVWRVRSSFHTSVVKIDNDVVVHKPDWLDMIEMVFEKDSKIGICGLKRKDLEERPDHENLWYRSTIRMLPHKAGEPWLVVEDCHHIMGTVQAYSSLLLDKIGYLYQPGIYGFDDSLASLRAQIAGFKTVFLLGIEIDHVDVGGTAFVQWKKDYAGEKMKEYEAARDNYKTGRWSVYYNGGELDA